PELVLLILIQEAAVDDGQRPHRAQLGQRAGPAGEAPVFAGIEVGEDIAPTQGVIANPIALGKGGDFLIEPQRPWADELDVELEGQRYAAFQRFAGGGAELEVD